MKHEKKSAGAWIAVAVFSCGVLVGGCAALLFLRNPIRRIQAGEEPPATTGESPDAARWAREIGAIQLAVDHPTFTNRAYRINERSWPVQGLERPRVALPGTLLNISPNNAVRNLDQEARGALESRLWAILRQRRVVLQNLVSRENELVNSSPYPGLVIDDQTSYVDVEGKLFVLRKGDDARHDFLISELARLDAQYSAIGMGEDE